MSTTTPRKKRHHLVILAQAQLVVEEFIDLPTEMTPHTYVPDFEDRVIEILTVAELEEDTTELGLYLMRQHFISAAGLYENNENEQASLEIIRGFQDFCNLIKEREASFKLSELGNELWSVIYELRYVRS